MSTVTIKMRSARLERAKDSQRMDKLAAMWDSQREGHHLMGRWFPNTTGSFRDAIDAYNPKPKT